MYDGLYCVPDYLTSKLVTRGQVSGRVIRNSQQLNIPGGEKRWLQGNLWYSPPASMTSRLASVTFKMASKVSIEETDIILFFLHNNIFLFYFIFICHTIITKNIRKEEKKKWRRDLTETIVAYERLGLLELRG